MARIFFIKPNNLLPYNFVTQPLGVMYLTSVLREKGDHRIALLDMRLRPITVEEAVQKTLDFEPDIVGFTTLTLEYGVVKRLARGIKEARPEVTTVVGGPHASPRRTTCFPIPTSTTSSSARGRRPFPSLRT